MAVASSLEWAPNLVSTCCMWFRTVLTLEVQLLGDRLVAPTQRGDPQDLQLPFGQIGAQPPPAPAPTMVRNMSGDTGIWSEATARIAARISVDSVSLGDEPVGARPP